MVVLSLLLTLLLLAVAARSQLLPANQVQATWNLDLGSSLLAGNTVFAAPNGKLLVTTVNGNLHIVDPTTNEVDTFVPDPVPGLDTPVCRSGVIYTEEYAIYAVSDEDSSFRFPTSSRLIAVNYDGTERWTVNLDGVVAGTPVLSNSGYLYVTHNVEENFTFAGRLSVIKLSPGGPELAATLPEQSTLTPFGPPAVQTQDKDGDVVYFCLSSDQNSARGALYVVQWSKDHSRQNGLGQQSYSFVVGSTALGSCVSAPAVNDDLEVYVGTRGSILVGWENGAEQALLSGDSQNTAAPWTYNLERNQNNRNAPIPSSPVLSDSGDFLFVASAGREVLALNSAGQAVAWQEDLLNPTLSRPVYRLVDGEPPVVYFLESRGGSLVQYSAESGTLNWRINCGQQCANVEADFSVSPTETMVYYGDVNGRLVGIRVANFETQVPATVETSSPVANPVPATSSPTAVPVSVPVAGTPTAAPVETTIPTNDRDKPSDESAAEDNQSGEESGFFSTKMIALVGGCGGLLALILVTCYILRNRKNKNKHAPAEKPACDEEQARHLSAKGNEGADDAVVVTPAKKTSANRSDGSVGSHQDGTPETLKSVDEADAESTADSGFEVNIDKSVSEVSAAQIARDLERELEDTFSVPSAAASVTSGGSGRSRRSRKSARSTDAGSVSSGGSQKRSLTLFPRKAKSPAASPTPSYLEPGKIQANQPPTSPRSTDAGSVSSGGSQKRSLTLFPRKAKSPASSPTPSYLEPGKIQANQPPTSPLASVFSVDSVYMDESTVASSEMQLDTPKGDDAIHGTGSFSELPNDCPEDEFSKKLRPGSHYLLRHNTKKNLEPALPTIPSDNEHKSRETRPMYKGVSVRPGRSKAGIFSRRQQPISNLPADEELASEETRPEVPILKKNRKSKVIRSETPPPSEAQGEVSSPPHFTAHGYYVEEPDESLLYSSQDEADSQVYAGAAVKKGSKPAKEVDNAAEEKKEDMWGSFMKELSKVESTFFNPTNAAPPEETDDESSAPPAPRTFYA